MTIEQLLAWAREHNYPMLALGTKRYEVIGPGWYDWCEIIKGPQERIDRVMARIQEWRAQEDRAMRGEANHSHPSIQERSEHYV